MMPISANEKALLFSNLGNPVVGLIHKKTKDIVFALCIPEKVSLVLDGSGKAQQGMFMADETQQSREISETELERINDLLKRNYVPRLVWFSLEEKSAHQFLFDQKCGSTRSSEWGGFALRLNSQGHITYEFSSGAFNSPGGQRIRGAQLSIELQQDVKQQLAALKSEIFPDQDHLVSPDEESLPKKEDNLYVTPPRPKRTLPSLFGKSPYEPPTKKNEALMHDCPRMG